MSRFNQCSFILFRAHTPMLLYFPMSTDYHAADPGVFFSQLRQLHACALRGTLYI